NPSKLRKMECETTEMLVQSLAPGGRDCLKADGTILDGHHRVYVLRKRGVEVDGLAREIIVSTQPASRE
ncbi:MAG: hypothetical protein WBS24_16795, partial [Terriglobales bacterium]